MRHHLYAIAGTTSIIITPVLRACQQVNDPSLKSELTAGIKPTLDYLMTLKFPSGNYPSSIGSAGGDLLVHWCHGAPGWIHLFALAYKVRLSVCANIVNSC